MHSAFFVQQEVNNMRIGTTPTHIFTLPFNAEMVENVEIVYHQFGKNVLVKDIEDCEMSGNEISVTLTQEETFLFDGSANVEIQLRVVTQNDEALASDIIRVPCYKCLSNEVL
jgi:hypothetical protein